MASALPIANDTKKATLTKSVAELRKVLERIQMKSPPLQENDSNEVALAIRKIATQLSSFYFSPDTRSDAEGIVDTAADYLTNLPVTDHVQAVFGMLAEKTAHEATQFRGDPAVPLDPSLVSTYESLQAKAEKARLRVATAAGAKAGGRRRKRSKKTRRHSKTRAKKTRRN